MAGTKRDQLLKWCGFNAQGDFGPLTAYTNMNNRLIMYPRAPPISPPNQAQEAQRNLFRWASAAWAATLPDAKKNWELASKRARLRITGYNLFTYYRMTNDVATIRTIERITKLSLIG